LASGDYLTEEDPYDAHILDALRAVYWTLRRLEDRQDAGPPL